MRPLQLLVVICLPILFLAACGDPSATPKAAGQVADTVYTNGKIYTVNEAQPWVEAVAIKDGAFVVVGSNANVAVVTGDATTVVDLGGRMAMPGLIDTHNHATGASMGKAKPFTFSGAIAGGADICASALPTAIKPADLCSRFGRRTRSARIRSG